MYERARALAAQLASLQPARTDVPARLDRLPWSRWHWLVAVSLGVAWALTGLEAAVAAAVAPALTAGQTLDLSGLQVGFAATIYLFGAVLSAPVFGYLSDLLGRRRLFLVALGIYLVGAFVTALSWTFWSFALFRFITGVGIGGEYATINTIVAELMPARTRGLATLAVNGSYWAGAIVGAAATIALLNPDVLAQNLGWRVPFLVGVVLVFAIPLVRHNVPESPRQLMVLGRTPQANAVVGTIEERVRRATGGRMLPKPGSPILVRPRGPINLYAIATTLLQTYPRRSLLAFSLMAGQAFLFNGIFFTYTLLLAAFYGVPSGNVGIYLAGLGFGSLLGPWTLGRLFDASGRRSAIALTYLMSGVLLGITGYLFSLDVLNAATQTIAWATILFFASAGASGAYLTASELFPQELRGSAAGIFFAAGTLVGLAGPPVFAALIQSGSTEQPFYGYLAAAVLMVAAGLMELFLGIDAERRTLESIARPLSVQPVRVVSPRPKKGKRRAA